MSAHVAEPESWITAIFIDGPMKGQIVTSPHGGPRILVERTPPDEVAAAEALAMYAVAQRVNFYYPQIFAVGDLEINVWSQRPAHVLADDTGETMRTILLAGDVRAAIARDRRTT